MPYSDDAEPAVIFLPGSPEAIFRVHDVTGTPLHTSGRMTTGDWMRGPDGNVALGSLGVLADVAVGSPAVSWRPSGGWAVTTEMAVTFCASPPTDGTELLCESSCIHHDRRAAVTVGRIRSAGGEQHVAVVHQRLAFTRNPVTTDGQTISNQPCDAQDILTLMGAHTNGNSLSLAVGDAVLNPGNVLHGGVSIYLSELLGSSALAQGTPGLTPSSLTINWLRPTFAGATLQFHARVENIGPTWALVRAWSTGYDNRTHTHALITYHKPASSRH